MASLPPRPTRLQRAWAAVLLALLMPALPALLGGCGSRVLLVDQGPQAYYQTAFPVRDTSRELERTFRSLHRVVYTAEYETFYFTPDAGVMESDLEDPAVLERAVEQFTELDSKAGTAVVVARAEAAMALVTNDHVVHFPPVRILHLDDDALRLPRGQRRVASVSIRRGEWGVLADNPELGTFAVLARDPVTDLAILEVSLPEWVPPTAFPRLGLPSGDPGRLSWGSFVYVLGYPSGYAMVTRAIVSDPDRDLRGGFLTDGLWNEGISGGVLLAVRGDTGALEWVGVARAGAGTREVRLQPGGFDFLEGDEGVLYEGPIFAESTLRIQYGITLSVSMTLIRSFLDEHRTLLQRRGHDLRRY
ncbi:MAG: serine protease [Gemmatimonadales bacterium]|nr:MAG: serine protease [Gemmatimonadales bacterium]